MGICRRRERPAQRQRSHQSRAAPISTCAADSNPAISTSSFIPAKNPLVLGLGFAVVRDLVSFLRFESKDRAGKANPSSARGKQEPTGITHAYAWGRSQSGRYLRDFVYHGFNEDESAEKSSTPSRPMSPAADGCL